VADIQPPERGASGTSQRTLVVLHGHGGIGSAAATLAAAIDPDGTAVHVTPDGPVVLRTGEHAWFDNGSASSIRTAGAVVRGALEGVDGPGVVVVGWSQGGAAALAALALEDAEPLPGVVGLALLGSFLADAPGLHYDLSRLAGVPVLIQHGSDDDVVPAFFAADLAHALTDAGVEVDHREVPLGHELDDAAVAEVAEWVTSRWRDVT